MRGEPPQSKVPAIAARATPKQRAIKEGERKGEERRRKGAGDEKAETDGNPRKAGGAPRGDAQAARSLRNPGWLRRQAPQPLLTLTQACGVVRSVRFVRPPRPCGRFFVTSSRRSPFVSLATFSLGK